MTQLIKTFFELIKVDSPTGEEMAVAELVVRKLAEMGIIANIDGVGNVLARVPGREGREIMLLCAHLDTVEPGRGIEPVLHSDGTIYSKGKTILGADNKAALAVILEAVRELSKNGFRENHPLDLVFSVGEEAGSRGTHGLDYGWLRAKRGYIFDASDGEVGDIEVASPFYNRLDIRIRGKAAHAKDPELGVSVLEILTKALSGVGLGRVSENTLVNLGLVKMGTGVNVVPGEAEILGEVRSYHEGELAEITEKIFGVFKNEAKRTGIEVETRAERENSGYVYDEKDDFVVETVSKLENIGLTPKLLEVWGCSDANIFAEHGLKVLNIVDGGRDSHTVNEEVTMEELNRLQEVVLGLVK